MSFKSLFNYLLMFFYIHFLSYIFPLWANTSLESNSKPSSLEQFFPLILIGIFFYILLIRPQQKKYKLHGEFLSKLKRGDEVLTSGGIYGKIDGLTDQFVILDISEGVCIRVVKSQIASYVEKTEKNKTKKQKK